MPQYKVIQLLTLTSLALAGLGCQSGHNTHAISSTEQVTQAVFITDAYSGSELWRKVIPSGHELKLEVRSCICQPMPMGYWVSDSRQLRDLCWTLYDSDQLGASIVAQGHRDLADAEILLNVAAKDNGAAPSVDPDAPAGTGPQKDDKTRRVPDQ